MALIELRRVALQRLIAKHGPSRGHWLEYCSFVQSGLRPASYLLAYTRALNGIGGWESGLPASEEVKLTKSAGYADAKQRVDEIVIADAAMIKAIGGHIRVCPKCKSSVEFVLKQLRSADEPMTVFISCTKCKWKIKQ